MYYLWNLLVIRYRKKNWDEPPWNGIVDTDKAAVSLTVVSGSTHDAHDRYRSLQQQERAPINRGLVFPRDNDNMYHF